MGKAAGKSKSVASGAGSKTKAYVNPFDKVTPS